MSKGPKQVTNFVKRAETIVILIVLKGFSLASGLLLVPLFFTLDYIF